jgi:hypothetical protein
MPSPEPVTGPYAEPGESTAYPHTPFFKIHFNIIYNCLIYIHLSSGLSALGFWTKFLISHMRYVIGSVLELGHWQTHTQTAWRSDRPSFLPQEKKVG